MVPPFPGQASSLPITWASARAACFSPGYNIAGLQPSESASELLRHDKCTCFRGQVDSLNFRNDFLRTVSNLRYECEPTVEIQLLASAAA
jgi:hypothetical protein